MLRKLTSVVMGMVLAASGLVLSGQPAAAASLDGDLRIKGPGGSTWTQSPFVSMVGAEGATLTWTFQVVNTGTTLAQYKLRVLDFTPPASMSLYDGTLALTPLASSPDGYYTKAIPPGGNQVLTAKLKIPAGHAGVQYFSGVWMYATSGEFLDLLQMYGEQSAAPSTGGYDLSLKSANQAAVGNRFDTNQISTGPTLPATGSTTYTAVIKNTSSATPRTGTLRVASDAVCPGWSVVVKDGVNDVTSAALSPAGYAPPPISKGGSRTLKVTVRASNPQCAYVAWAVSATSGGATQRSYTLTNRAL